ncbi:MAG: molybdopterin-guanine dinucleotide biosynthesis protein B [Gammaproteobacteria bacterium]|nr:molybdopterin-guanine dinucleotide biosynthesis protein B [Gammaproteobacteria bacterium]
MTTPPASISEQVSVPVLGIAAFSGTGKTTLLEAVIPDLTAKGLNIGLIKHSHHQFQIDHPGKDSYRLRQAGAGQIVLAAQTRTAVIIEKTDSEQPPDLTDQFRYLDQSTLDLIIVEGFKKAAIPKIELHRSTLGHPYLFPNDSNIFALVADSKPAIAIDIPVLDLNQPHQITDFILNDWLTGYG